MHISDWSSDVCSSDLALMNDQSPRGGASWPCRAHGAEKTASQRHVQIGAFSDYNGIVAAQLQKGPAKTSAYHSAYRFPHSGRARDRNQRNPGILCDHLSRVTPPCQEPWYAFRYIILPKNCCCNFLASHCRKRRFF